MPLVAWAALSYAAGLVWGLAVGPSVAIAAVLLGAAACSIWLAVGRPAVAACAALVVGGVFSGLDAGNADHGCRDRLANLKSWDVVLESPAAPGSVSRAAVNVAGCRMRAILLVTAGRAAAGDAAAARGAASVDERGGVIRGAVLTSIHRPRTLSALRAAVGARIDRLFGADAPIVRALVIADMSGIPIEQRDRFARAGLVHMLSVSGLHVAIIALALELLATALRAPPT